MRLQPRDYKLLFALLLVGVVSLVATGITQSFFAEKMIKEKANDAAVQWASFLRTNLTDLESILEKGEITATDRILLLTANDIGGVFRFKVYDRTGTVVVASREADIGTTAISEDLATVMATGQPLSQVAHDTPFDGERQVVSTAILPFVKAGEFSGAVEVYVDTTAEADHLNENSLYSFLSILNLIIVVSAIVGYFVYRNMVASNRDLRSASEERDRAADAEREVRDLNRVLEDRVRERTADLEEANARINRMNRDLETRVTERTAELRAREHDLKESEQRFRAFAEASSDWFWEMDESLRYCYLSERFQEVTGLDPQSLFGKEWTDYARDQADSEALREQLQTLASHRPFRNYVERRSLPDGQVRYLSLNGTPWFDEEGTFKGYRGTGADITKLREAEADAADAQSRLEDAIAAMADGFVLYDSDDRLVTCNNRFREIYHEVAERLVRGTAYRDIAEGGVLRAQLPGRHDAKGDGHREAIEVQMGERWLRVSESRTQDGGTVAIHTDISQVKRLQSESIEKERLTTLGELTAKLSHELRNPLGAIRNSTYTVAQQLTQEGSQAERALERIDRNIERCDKIITALLNYAHNRRPAPADLEIDSWLARSVGKLGLTEGISLVTEFGAPDTWTSVDPALFSTAIAQVIENAVQACLPSRAENGGKPEGDPPPITLTTRMIDERVEIEIHDDGPGIDPEVLPNVFDPLFSTKTYGVGLGLATVKLIVEQHSGEVEIESVPGRGTSVFIRLPVGKAQGRSAERTAA